MWVPEQQRGNSRHCVSKASSDNALQQLAVSAQEAGERLLVPFGGSSVSMLLFYCLPLPSPGGSVRMMLLFKIVCLGSYMFHNYIQSY